MDISTTLLKGLHKKDYTVDAFDAYVNKHRVDIHRVVYEKTGDSIMHVVSRVGNVTLLEHLISFGLDVNGRNNDCKTPLHEASQFVQYDVVKVLVGSGADVNALKKADWTPLMLACTKTGENALKTIQCLCENGAMIDLTNKDGWSALHLTSREGDIQIVEYITNRVEQTDARTKNGRTALHIAALHGHHRVVKFLLGTIPVGVKDNCGNNPLHEATCGRHFDVIKLLINHKADVSSLNDFGFNCLHISASEGYVELIRFFVDDLGMDVNATTRLSYTPLHCAARKKQLNVIDLLIGYGANETIQDVHKRLYKDYLNL